MCAPRRARARHCTVNIRSDLSRFRAGTPTLTFLTLDCATYRTLVLSGKSGAAMHSCAGGTGPLGGCSRVGDAMLTWLWL
jgi:hypothetical protein